MKVLILLCFIALAFCHEEFASARSDYDLLAGPCQSIIQEALNNGQAYRRLQYMCDRFGNRLSGSDRLEEAIDWIVQEVKADGIDRVWTEEVSLPATWNRGTEWAKLITPQQNSHTIGMLGLGFSIGTNGQPLSAPVFVVSSFDDFERYQSQIVGKIVVVNRVYANYGEGSLYRQESTYYAAKYGAVAVLIRSVASFSLSTPHTGMGVNDSNPTPIPSACITIEDADLLTRLQEEGREIIIQLYMEAQMGPPAKSRNVLAEIVGSEFPEQLIIFGGHIDSWDVGQGSLDDGGGVMVSWEVLRILHTLNLRPKRTVRMVMFTDEEVTFMGANTYYNDHQNEFNNTILAIETDEGVFQPYALGFNGSESATRMLNLIGSACLSPIGTGNVTQGYMGEDIAQVCATGVPCGSLKVVDSTADGPLDEKNRYFWYHHSNADTMLALNKREVEMSAATMAGWIYSVASVPTALPRN